MDTLDKFLTLYKTGDVVYRKEETQTNFFIINKGKIQLKAGASDMPLITLSKGDFFGEESLLPEKVAIYTAEVIEEAAIIKIPYDSLTEMMKQSNEISLKILKKLSEKHLRIQSMLLPLTNSPHPQKEKEKHGKASSKEKTDEVIQPDIKAFLIIQRSNRLVQLTKKDTCLGRRDYTTGFIPDIDLTEEDEEKYISRKHARILFSQSKFYFFEEPGAINGTFLNGNKLESGVKYPLKSGDELTLCHLNIIFKY